MRRYKEVLIKGLMMGLMLVGLFGFSALAGEEWLTDFNQAKSLRQTPNNQGFYGFFLKTFPVFPCCVGNSLEFHSKLSFRKIKTSFWLLKSLN